MTLYHLAKRIESIPPGQCFAVGTGILRDLAPPACLAGPLGPEWTPAERIMENIIGSAYSFRYWQSMDRETITFEKLKNPLTDGRRTYVSPDRRELFVQDAAGFYSPIGQPLTPPPAP